MWNQGGNALSKMKRKEKELMFVLEWNIEWTATPIQAHVYDMNDIVISIVVVVVVSFIFDSTPTAVTDGFSVDWTHTYI